MSAIIEIMLERVEEKKINNQINIEPGSSACQASDMLLNGGWWKLPQTLNLSVDRICRQIKKKREWSEDKESGKVKGVGGKEIEENPR